MDELKPCPFCNGEMMLRGALWPSEGDRDAIIHKESNKCGFYAFEIDTFDDGKSVSEAWNRVAPDADKRIAELEAALAFYGDPATYEVRGHPQIDADTVPIMHDRGDRARAALAPTAGKVSVLSPGPGDQERRD